MKSLYEFQNDGMILRLEDYPNIRKNFPEARIVWNMCGMRGVIPPQILEAQYKLMDQYGSRLRAYDRTPEAIGMVTWESVVRVPSHGYQVDHPIDEDTERPTECPPT